MIVVALVLVAFAVLIGFNVAVMMRTDRGPVASLLHGIRSGPPT